MVAMYQFGVTPAVEDGAAKASREFADFVRGYARKRRCRLGDDLISAAPYAGKRGRPLSEDELVSTVRAAAERRPRGDGARIGNGVKAMLDSGSTRAAASPKQRGSRATVEELVRLGPPLHLFTRYALEDVEYAGVSFRKGQ